MSLREIVGQDRALRILRSLLSTRSLPPALLFQGPEGVGKASAALRFGRAINCSRGGEGCPTGAPDACPSCAAVDRGLSPDIHRVNAAYQASLLDEEEAKQRSLRIDTIRHVIRDLEMRSLEGRRKAALVEDAHLLVPAAANAMLKALEEPPPGTLWVLVTHRPEELLPTIRSRCQPIRFSRLPEGVIAGRLVELGVEERAADEAARTSEGSLGRALSLARLPGEEPAFRIADPLGPFALADSLPRELHKSRPMAAEELRRLAWSVRQRHGTEGYGSPSIRAALKELARLRRALDSNADPRLVVELAAFAVQAVESSSQERIAK